jgi:hypothetical protein
MCGANGERTASLRVRGSWPCTKLYYLNKQIRMPNIKFSKFSYKLFKNPSSCDQSHHRWLGLGELIIEKAPRIVTVNQAKRKKFKF